MTNKAWSFLAAVGLFGVAMGGCVVGSSDDDDDTGGSGGITSGGGSGGTGNSTSGGGSGGTTGGSGGVAGSTGGASAVDCDPPQPPANPGACTAEPGNTCQTCIEQNCCTEYSNCVATSPDDSCGWGGPAGEGEMTCIQNCVFDAQADGGVADPDTISACVGACTTPSCSQATISPQTNDLLVCVQDGCFAECLQQ